MLSGYTAAGKTTHAHVLAGVFGLHYVSASQILLSMLGKSPVQAPDFWVTDEGKAVWMTPEARRVDDELVRLESTMTHTVFDAFTMPWLHKGPALTIWLESSFDSRVLKATISHRGHTGREESELRQRLREKDGALQRRLREMGVDPAVVTAQFDLVLDISSFISGPTFRDALGSIEAANELITSVAGWWLFGDSYFSSAFSAARRGYGEEVILRCPPGLGSN